MTRHSHGHSQAILHLFSRTRRDLVGVEAAFRRAHAGLNAHAGPKAAATLSIQILGNDTSLRAGTGKSACATSRWASVAVSGCIAS